MDFDDYLGLGMRFHYPRASMPLQAGQHPALYSLRDR